MPTPPQAAIFDVDVALIGLDRFAEEALPENAGADTVVNTLDDIDVGVLVQGRRAR